MAYLNSYQESAKIRIEKELQRMRLMGKQNTQEYSDLELTLFEILNDL